MAPVDRATDTDYNYGELFDAEFGLQGEQQFRKEQQKYRGSHAFFF